MNTSTEVFSNHQAEAEQSPQVGFFANAWRKINQWIEIRRSRRQLESLPDYLLRDIGIHRSLIHSVTLHGINR
jgi:uncharacterized protein YjiS (DUF1127 family)